MSPHKNPPPVVLTTSDDLCALATEVSRAVGESSAGPSSSKKSKHVEKAKIQQLTNTLSMRLRYAKLKVDHGWVRQNFNEVENLYFHHYRSTRPPVPTVITRKPGGPWTHNVSGNAAAGPSKDVETNASTSAPAPAPPTRPRLDPGAYSIENTNTSMALDLSPTNTSPEISPTIADSQPTVSATASASKTINPFSSTTNPFLNPFISTTAPIPFKVSRAPTMPVGSRPSASGALKRHASSPRSPTRSPSKTLTKVVNKNTSTPSTLQSPLTKLQAPQIASSGGSMGPTSYESFWSSLGSSSFKGINTAGALGPMANPNAMLSAGGEGSNSYESVLGQ